MLVALRNKAMKKLFFASTAMLAMLSFSACDTKKGGNEEGKETVIERDSVPSEYKVTEKTVETDTTTNTKTVDADEAKKDSTKK
jgi:hypothetical protein